jgi:hypothetical protein
MRPQPTQGDRPRRATQGQAGGSRYRSAEGRACTAPCDQSDGCAAREHRRGDQKEAGSARYQGSSRRRRQKEDGTLRQKCEPDEPSLKGGVIAFRGPNWDVHTILVAFPKSESFVFAPKSIEMGEMFQKHPAFSKHESVPASFVAVSSREVRSANQRPMPADRRVPVVLVGSAKRVAAN